MMAGPLIADRVKETTTTTGAGTLSLAGAMTGFRSFVAAIGDGNSCYYCITDGTDWEIGVGTVTDATPDTLSRDSILKSSNANAAVDWSAGGKEVWVTWPAAFPLNRVAVPDGNVDLNSKNIVNLADPAGAQDAATKAYVDSEIAGVGGSTPTGTGFRHVTSGTEDAAAKLVDTADINANQVTNAKLAQMAQSSIKGRAAGAGTGDPSDLSSAQATAILDNMVGDSGAGGTKGLAPAPAAGDAAAGKFLKANGTWAAPTSTLDINGLTAKTQPLGTSDVVPVYDATDAANRKLPLAGLLGLRNYIVNGDFSVFRGDSGGSNSVTFNDNAGSYANGWRFLGESNGSTKFRRASYATNGAKYKLILEVGTNNEKFGIWYTLPNDRVMELRGKTITLSVWLKVSNTRIGNVKMGVAESTGTVDQTGTDPISAWGGDGTTPTLTGWSFLNTPANLNVTASSVRYSVTVTVGASANNLAVFIWNDDKTNTAADQLEIEDVQLEQGSIPTPYARLPEFLVCAIMQARIFQVLLPQDNEPPASSYATLDTRNSHPVLDFDDASTEAAVFSFVLSQRFGAYRASNGFDIILIWAATSATTGNVVWQASAERLALNDQDIDSDGFGSTTTKTDACQGTSGKLSYTKFGSTGISNDTMAAGEAGRLKIERVGGNGSDTMSGDAELKAVLIVEPLDVEMALPAV